MSVSLIEGDMASLLFILFGGGVVFIPASPSKRGVASILLSLIEGGVAFISVIPSERHGHSDCQSR